MNGPGDLTVTHSSATPDPKNCSLVSIIPIVGMSSCRGRAEAFARRLSSKLRTLGTQDDDADVSQEDEPIINGGNTNTWVSGGDGSEQTVTDLQPLRHESDSFFDFDLELESPGSPVDECEYLRLIESTSNTPHTSAAESGYACASAASSHSSSDGPYFDVNSENEACTSHLQHQPQQQQQQQQHQLKTSSHICPPHHHNKQPLTAKDEVDCISTAAQPEGYGQCNGYQHHEDLIETLPSEGPDIDLDKTITEDNQQQIDKQIDITQSVQAQILQELHKQSQDFKADERESKDYNLENQNNEIKTTVTTTETNKEINKEVDKETNNETCSETSKDTNNETCKETDKDTNNETCKETDKETSIETSSETTSETLPVDLQETQTQTEKETKQIIHIINGHVENDEEVIKVEVLEYVTDQAIQEQKLVTEDASNDCAKVTIIKDSKETEISKTATDTDKPKSSHLHMDTTDDEDDCRPQRIRRCSSLKTGKTPPGTPGRKKIVRFADVLGLDLADVKTFLDEIPTVPKSAYEDLEILESEPPIQLGPKADKLLMPLFQQPGGLANYLDIVREKLVSLENAAVTDGINHTITGSVRVRNLDFHKSVHIRYSLDGWRSFADLQANYVENSCDGFSDKFTFVIFGNSLHIGQRLEFAVRFQCKGQQYWDNNYGANYCFQCLPTSAPIINPISTVLPSHGSNHMASLLSPTVGETWCSSFY